MLIRQRAGRCGSGRNRSQHPRPAPKRQPPGEVEVSQHRIAVRSTHHRGDEPRSLRFTGHHPEDGERLQRVHRSGTESSPTLCWRGLDSKFQFRATFGGLAGLRVTRSAQSSGSYRSPFRLAAGGSGFELRLRGFGPRLSSLVCRLESLGIPLKARILLESNGIEDGGTGSQSSPWINVRSRVSAQLVVAPGPWSPATRHHLAPPTNSPDRFRAGRSPAPSGSSRTRSHDTASAARSRS